MNEEKDRSRATTVLFLTGCVGKGGAGHSLFYLIKYLDRTLVKPIVVMPDEGLIGEKLRKRGVKIVIPSHLKERFYEMRFKHSNSLTYLLSLIINSFDSLFFVFELARIARKEKVDCIYCNHMMVKIFGAVAGLLIKRPVIWHCRTVYSNSLERLLFSCFGKLPHVKKIISVSKAAASNYHSLKHKVKVIPNGVDFQEYNSDSITGNLRSQYQIPESAIVVGYVGRIVKWKGIDVFLDVANKTLSVREDVFFVVIGGNPSGAAQDNLNTYRKSFSKNGYQNRVFFTGFIYDVRSCFIDLDLVLIPSIKPDPCPRSVIEAMALGIPVMGSASGGIQEIIEDGYNGFLIEPENVTEVTERLLELVDNENLRARLGRNAYHTVRERYDVAILAQGIQTTILEECSQSVKARDYQVESTDCHV